MAWNTEEDFWNDYDKITAYDSDENEELPDFYLYSNKYENNKQKKKKLINILENDLKNQNVAMAYELEDSDDDVENYDRNRKHINFSLENTKAISQKIYEACGVCQTNDDIKSIWQSSNKIDTPVQNDKVTLKYQANKKNRKTQISLNKNNEEINERQKSEQKAFKFTKLLKNGTTKDSKNIYNETDVKNKEKITDKETKLNIEISNEKTKMKLKKQSEHIPSEIFKNDNVENPIKIDTNLSSIKQRKKIDPCSISLINDFLLSKDNKSNISNSYDLKIKNVNSNLKKSSKMFNNVASKKDVISQNFEIENNQSIKLDEISKQTKLNSIKFLKNDSININFMNDVKQKKKIDLNSINLVNDILLANNKTVLDKNKSNVLNNLTTKSTVANSKESSFLSKVAIKNDELNKNTKKNQKSRLAANFEFFKNISQETIPDNLLSCTKSLNENGETTKQDELTTKTHIRESEKSFEVKKNAIKKEIENSYIVKTFSNNNKEENNDDDEFQIKNDIKKEIDNSCVVKSFSNYNGTEEMDDDDDFKIPEIIKSSTKFKVYHFINDNSSDDEIEDYFQKDTKIIKSSQYGMPSAVNTEDQIINVLKNLRQKEMKFQSNKMSSALSFEDKFINLSDNKSSKNEIPSEEQVCNLFENSKQQETKLEFKVPSLLLNLEEKLIEQNEFSEKIEGLKSQNNCEMSTSVADCQNNALKLMENIEQKEYFNGTTENTNFWDWKWLSNQSELENKANDQTIISKTDCSTDILNVKNSVIEQVVNVNNLSESFDSENSETENVKFWNFDWITKNLDLENKLQSTENELFPTDSKIESISEDESDKNIQGLIKIQNEPNKNDIDNLKIDEKLNCDGKIKFNDDLDTIADDESNNYDEVNKNNSNQLIKNKMNENELSKNSNFSFYDDYKHYDIKKYKELDYVQSNSNTIKENYELSVSNDNSIDYDALEDFGTRTEQIKLLQYYENLKYNNNDQYYEGKLKNSRKKYKNITNEIVTTSTFNRNESEESQVPLERSRIPAGYNITRGIIPNWGEHFENELKGSIKKEDFPPLS